MLGKHLHLEHIVTSRLAKHAEQNNTLHVQNKGCENQLVGLVSNMSAMINSREQVQACMLGF